MQVWHMQLDAMRNRIIRLNLHLEFAGIAVMTATLPAGALMPDELPLCRLSNFSLLPQVYKLVRMLRELRWHAAVACARSPQMHLHSATLRQPCPASLQPSSA